MSAENTEKPFFVKAAGGNKIKINFNDVYFIRAAREYVEIITRLKTYLIHSTFKSFYESLPNQDQFIKIHRSYIVNMSKIESIGSKHVVVNKEKLPVSLTYLNNLKSFERDNIILINNI